MYIVVICSNCKASIHVAESSVGKTVECPVCRQATPAQAVQPAVPVAKKIPAPQEPLSLDDAPELPLRRDPWAKPRLPAPHPRRRFSTAIHAVGSLALTLVVMGSIYLGYRWWQKDHANWERFAPPNGDCTVLMPVAPTEADILAVGFADLGGKRYTATWKSKSNQAKGKSKNETSEVSLGWIDLDASKLQGVQFEQIAIPVREREAQRIEGKSRLESAVGFTAHGKAYEAREYVIETEKGIAVLRLYLQAGDPRKRMYILMARGPDLDPKDEWVAVFFNSFKPLR